MQAKPASVCGSAGGASCAEGGEERIAKRSRSVTARRRAADGSPPHLRPIPMPLVTSARICEENGHGREAYERPTARETKQSARWSRRNNCYSGFNSRSHSFSKVRMLSNLGGYLLGFGAPHFLSTEPFRNGKQSVIAAKMDWILVVAECYFPHIILEILAFETKRVSDLFRL
jgi:hypothetical protein